MEKHVFRAQSAGIVGLDYDNFLKSKVLELAENLAHPLCIPSPKKTLPCMKKVPAYHGSTHSIIEANMDILCLHAFMVLPRASLDTVAGLLGEVCFKVPIGCKLAWVVMGGMGLFCGLFNISLT